MDWSQYTTISINRLTFYLIKNLDDNLCLAINKADTLTDDEIAGSYIPMYVILAQTDNVNS